ncbi:hypothetical protein SAMN05444416_104191 [Thermoactinomyces sp. DSM 45892]|nr:hypothetical protein SAMN05444416_104191 [Thermoactinomyces sp. DSM 45892]
MMRKGEKPLYWVVVFRTHIDVKILVNNVAMIEIKEF